MKKMFNSRKYKDFAGIYEISLTPTIKIVNKNTNNVLKQHDRGFVRLSGNGKCISITVQRMILLTYKPHGYREGYIAITKDGNPSNLSLNNLKWGTRKEQAQIAMSIESRFETIQKIGRKYGTKNWRKNLITDGRFLPNKALSKKVVATIKSYLKHGKTPTEISNMLSVSRSTVYHYK